MDSEPRNASKNTCLQQTSCSTNPCTWCASVDCQFGFVEGVKRENLGNPQRTWSIGSYVVGFCYVFIMARRGGLNTTMLMEICFTSGEGCDKDVYWVRGCSRLFSKQPLDAGVGELARLAWIFRMACARSWIWGLRTITFFLPKPFRKQNFYWTNWWHVSPPGTGYFLCWPVSRCAYGRGATPGLPLPGWEAAPCLGGQTWETRWVKGG